MSMEEVPTFLGFGVWQPDHFGRARQVSFTYAHRTDLVVVGVSFLELAHMTTLQDQSAAPNGGQSPHHVEAVAGSFQDEEVLGSGVLLGPTEKLSHGHFIEYFLGHCSRWRLAGQERSGEGVGVRVKANHPLDRVLSRCSYYYL